MASDPQWLTAALDEGLLVLLEKSLVEGPTWESTYYVYWVPFKLFAVIMTGRGQAYQEPAGACGTTLLQAAQIFPNLNSVGLVLVFQHWWRVNGINNASAGSTLLKGSNLYKGPPPCGPPRLRGPRGQGGRMADIWNQTAIKPAWHCNNAPVPTGGGLGPLSCHADCHRRAMGPQSSWRTRTGTLTSTWLPLDRGPRPSSSRSPR
jgi:hypothetical protein